MKSNRTLIMIHLLLVTTLSPYISAEVLDRNAVGMCHIQYGFRIKGFDGNLIQGVTVSWSINGALINSNYRKITNTLSYDGLSTGTGKGPIGTNFFMRGSIIQFARDNIDITFRFYKKGYLTKTYEERVNKKSAGYSPIINIELEEDPTLNVNVKMRNPKSTNNSQHSYGNNSNHSQNQHRPSNEGPPVNTQTSKVNPDKNSNLALILLAGGFFSLACAIIVLAVSMLKRK